MARASIYTWLPLDRFASIMGIAPLHFNQAYSDLMPLATSCNEAWMQKAWQGTDRLSREDLARAIRQAELMIAKQVGYNLSPDWSVDEKVRTTKLAHPPLFSTGEVNARFMKRSVTTGKNYIISGGRKLSTLVEAGALVVYSDPDGDGYDELATITVRTCDDCCDPCDIRIYFTNPYFFGTCDDEYEVRPICVTEDPAGILTITLDSWLLLLPQLAEKFGAAPIDADNMANYEGLVDVYCVTNDPSQMAYLIWEAEPNYCGCGSSSCSVCSFAQQAGCIAVRDHRRGIFTYSPGDWNATAGAYDATELAVGRDPDRLRLWYYSGWKDESLACPTRDMDREWERVVCYLAVALIDQNFCGCTNTKARMNYWREDLAELKRDGGWNTTENTLNCPWGTRRGALYAWRFIQENGRRVA